MIVVELAEGRGGGSVVAFTVGGVAVAPGVPGDAADVLEAVGGATVTGWLVEVGAEEGGIVSVGRCVVMTLIVGVTTLAVDVTALEVGVTIDGRTVTVGSRIVEGGKELGEVVVLVSGVTKRGQTARPMSSPVESVTRTRTM